ncbi:MAG: T9SS type A sorting domain-containing protein [Bacteroidales bacterium]|nr:T9SS type A sorting domain-containing protein [Bacteroidales bacterium]
MKSKLFFLIPVLTTIMVITGFTQEVSYDAKFDLTICTIKRNAPAELYIKNGSGNTFTGKLIVDNDEREVFGWYTEKISEGGIYIYNTRGIVFYVQLNQPGFQHQQLFKALYNYDETQISGTYFYWGNEFIFYGHRSDMIDNPVDPDPFDPNPDTVSVQLTIIIDNNIGDLINVSPNPANDIITISSSVVLLNNIYCELYSDSGMLIKVTDPFSDITQIGLNDIPNGTYIIKFFSIEGQELGTVKIIKH